MSKFLLTPPAFSWLPRTDHPSARRNRSTAAAVRPAAAQAGLRWPRIAAAVYGGTWAITPAGLRAVGEGLANAIQGGLPDLAAQLPPQALRFDDDHNRADPEGTAGVRPARTPELLDGGIARIACSGIIGKRISGLESMCGGLDVDDILTGLRRAEAHGGVHTVVMDWDSPGGYTTGVPEAAAAIRELCEASDKHIISYSETEMCSAAMWLGAMADEVICTPTATLGSIGVYNAVVDESAAWALAGLKLELFKAGDHKADGIPGLPLSDGAKEQIQAQVDAFYEAFTGAIRSTRGDIKDGDMQGQTFTGEHAHAVGLADGTVRDRGELLALIRSHAEDDDGEDTEAHRAMTTSGRNKKA